MVTFRLTPYFVPGFRIATIGTETIHQLCAEAAVLPGEDPEVIREFREDLLEHWQPANAQEQLEFEELVRSAWRLLRAREGGCAPAKAPPDP